MLKTHKRLLAEKPSRHGGAYHVDTQYTLFQVLSLCHLREPTKLKRNWIFFFKKSNSIFLCLITFLQLKLLKESFTAPDGWCFEGDWFINPELRFVQTNGQIHSFRTDHEISKNINFLG